MIELPLNHFYEKTVLEFETVNNCDATYWHDEFLQYLRNTYNCEYWERETQFGGPCFVFRDEKDYTFFRLKFS